jgi:Fe-S-cluster-containing hydrogenase component 2
MFMQNADERVYGRRIVQRPPEYSFCAGCESCAVVCALVHGGVVGPSRNRLFVERNIRTMVHTVHACQQCADRPCYEKCPKKGEAMRTDENGVVYIVEEACIGCGLCARACVFEPSRINFVKDAPKAQRKARKCDLCRGRAEGPACVEWCPVCCIRVADGEEAGS